MQSARIGVNDEELRHLVKMWGPQLGEHAMFLHMLIHEPILKQRGLDLFRDWRQFLCQEQFIDQPLLLQLVDATRVYKEEIIARLRRNEYLGAVFLSFAEHILREMQYFEDKLGGRVYTASEELEFWNRINSEHAGFAAHLLDPKHTFLTDTADALSKKINRLPTDAELSTVVMAIEAGVELDVFNKAAYAGSLVGAIRSVMPESLIYHVIREGQYGKSVLSSLIGETSEPVNRAKVCEHKL